MGIFVDFPLSMTKAENTHEIRHEKKIIVHDGLWHLASFDTETQLKFFLELTGVEFWKVEEKNDPILGKFEYFGSDFIVKEHGFTGYDQIPAEAKEFLGREGSFVKCFCHTRDKVLHVYRPNPNYPEVYNPLPLDMVIKDKKSKGNKYYEFGPYIEW